MPLDININIITLRNPSLYDFTGLIAAAEPFVRAELQEIEKRKKASVEKLARRLSHPGLRQRPSSIFPPLMTKGYSTSGAVVAPSSGGCAANVQDAW